MSTVLVTCVPIGCEIDNPLVNSYPQSKGGGGRERKRKRSEKREVKHFVGTCLQLRAIETRSKVCYICRENG